ncbi:MAG: peptidylprolyl isomerase [Gammaproteobacteria bacterium]|nr:peptidylprolyl isomerase [Gammaproteobacteria bacterium]
MNTESTSKPGLLLVMGALLGAILAASGVLEAPKPELGNELVASVNGEYISKSDYLGYLDLLARDKRNPMSAADRRHVLDRIIEEKLLIERGLGIGLPYSDPKIRKSIVDAMIQTIISDVSSAEPDRSNLQEFYHQNSNYFASLARIRVQRMVFRGEDAQQRAQAAYASLSAEDWHTVARKMADTDILSLPGSMLPISKLRGYLGPTLTELALNLPVGGYSPPHADQAGYTILQLLDLQRSEPQPLEKIREQVLREFQRRADDNALREYLQELREAADISIDEEFLERLESASV